METPKSTIMAPVKKMILLAAIAACSVILCYIFLFYQSGKHESDKNIMINSIGRQSMLTQMIAKEANSIYCLMQALESDKIYRPADIIQKKIASSRQSMANARDEFDRMLSSMNKGLLESVDGIIVIDGDIEGYAEYLEKINEMWSRYKSSVDTILIFDRIDANTTEALIYISENNLELLELCDNITETVITASIKEVRTNAYISVVLVVLSFLVIVYALFNLFKYIIEPFRELSRGIAGIGLSSVNFNTTIPTRQQLLPVVSEIGELFIKINHLIKIIENINKNTSFAETIDFINTNFRMFIPFNYIGIALFNDDKSILEAFYGASDGSITGLPYNLLGKQVLLENTSLGAVVSSGETRIINDLEAYLSNHPLTDYNSIILEAGIRSSITLPLKVSDEPVGIIFFSSHEKNVFKAEHVNFLKTLVNSIAISFDKNIYVNELLYSSVLALAKLAESRDEDTGEHLDRMKQYSKLIAQCMFERRLYKEIITPEFIINIERFSPMHDIGKVGIRDGILLKPGKLTHEEFEEMKKHTLYGAAVLKTAEANMARRGKGLFKMGIEIAESHHEKWNGTGYPYGKKGKEIPLSARIVAVADVFDALTSKRPYKEPFSFEDSMDMIIQGSGTHFDPEIVKVFLENKSKVYDIYSRFHH